MSQKLEVTLTIYSAMPRMSNYLLNIGLLLALLSFTASCNTQSKHQNTNKQPETLKGQISMWVETPLSLKEVQSSSNQKLSNNVIEEFRELYPQVKVFVKFFPSNQSWEPFELQVKRGAGPDLLLTYSSTKILSLIRIGALQSLENFEIDQSQFFPEALKQIRYQGELYGLPMYLSTQVLCYNKDRVKKLPRTLQELIEQARQGSYVGLHSGFTETFWGTGIFGSQLFDAQGQSILAQGEAWSKWMEWLKDTQNEPNFILSNNAQALQQAFVEGKLAYLTCSSEWIPYFREALGKDKLGATRLPGEANQPATPLLRTGVLLFNRASNPNQTRLALKLAQFLTNVEQQKQIEAEVPFIPSNKNVTVNRHLFPLRATLLDQAQSSVAFSLDDIEKLTVLIDDSDILYRKILAGEITPDEAATKLTQSINRQIKRQQ